MSIEAKNIFDNFFAEIQIVYGLEKNFPCHFSIDHALPGRNYLYPDQLDSGDDREQTGRSESPCGSRGEYRGAGIDRGAPDLAGL